MDIALFDLYTSGHHPSYAARLKSALETVSDHHVTFITLSETDQCKKWFERSDIEYIDSPDSQAIEDRSRDFGEVADAKIDKFCSNGMLERYDAVHFLYADDIFGPLWRHCPSSTATEIICEINGVFFHRGTVLQQKNIHSLWLRMLRSPAGSIADTILPDKTAHEALWADVYLYRFLKRGAFDSVVVHSQEAADYLSSLNSHPDSAIADIPYPVPASFGTDIPRSEAREQLSLPSDDRILLFFGGMRAERGINVLLEALRQYDGKPFTMLLAGPPTAVDSQDIEQLNRDSVINVIYEFGFIDTPELYYRAADAVVLPYIRKYGKERASQMFEEICGAMRPVIVPDFGVLGRATREWELGHVYEQGSTEALTNVIGDFAREEISYSREKMREYRRNHSYERVAATLAEIYSN